MIRKILTRFVLPLVILAGFAAAAVVLAKARRDPEPRVPVEKVTRVEIAVAEATSAPIVVRAHGTVLAAETTTIRPEVSGRVLELHPELLAGGRVGAGDVLVQLDKREFELVVEELESIVGRARFDLTVERGRRRTAQREWELLGDDGTADARGRSLALRTPHIRNARSGLNGAKRSVERATQNIERTTIRAPFDAIVTAETVAPQQVVMAQSQLATLARTDVFWVQAAVPTAQLRHFAIPGVAGATAGSPVTVTQDLGDGEPLVRQGTVVRLLADLDGRSRMARVIVAVDDPLALTAENAGALPLLLGAYVEVEIEGPRLEDVVRVPREALRGGRHVWVMNAEGRLELREVNIVWRQRDAVVVRDGLAAGERYVTSRISTPVPGMKLTLADPDSVEEVETDDLARATVTP